MKTVSWSIIAGVAWVVYAYKLRDLRRSPTNAALRALVASFGLIGVAMTLAIPPIARFVEQATGVYLVWLNVPLVTAWALLQVMTLLLTHPAEQAGPKVRLRLAAGGAAVLLMTVLAVLAPVDEAALAGAGSFEERERLLHGTPYAGECMLVFFGAFAFTVCDVGRQVLLHRRVVDRRWLRRGLGVVAWGFVLAMAYCLNRVVQVAALRYFGTLPEFTSYLGPPVVVVGVTSALIGWTMPGWGPKLDRVRAYRQLHPLWHALSRAVPQVVLQTPHLGRDRVWRVQDLDFRLYRRIIEIRDSRLALRAYLDEAVAAAARERAEEAGLEGDALRATVEAATLAAAIRAGAEDRPAVRPSAEDSPENVGLAGELVWFTQVARAFSRSPIVAEISARSAEPAGQGGVPPAGGDRPEPGGRPDYAGRRDGGDGVR